MILTLLAVLSLAVAADAQTTVPKEPPPAELPAKIPVGDWHLWHNVLDIEGSVYKMSGLPGIPAEMESSKMVVRGDVIEYDSDTGDVHAQGHVYFRDFEKNEEIWASRMEYNTEEKHGKFWDVRGETHPRIVTRPGILTVDAPFYFEGAWAERIGLKYILHDGWITNCKLPGPWWRMRGPKFVIVPHEYAKAYRGVFYLKRFPLFYAPFFYHSLAKEPRKSGFLIPNLVPHSQRGFMIGLGYYWAISRSYDATYRFQDFTTNAYSHHLDFRGNPKKGTDFDAILYGVQDHGNPADGPNPATYSGASIYVVGKTELGDGWSARGYLNYVSSFRFRQNWSESLAEVVGSEIHSVGFLSKDWANYDFSVTFARLENFQSSEVPITDPVTNKTSLLSNAITIRKLPEAELVGRDRHIWENAPLWFSFDTSAGLLSRSEPIFNSANTALIDTFQTGQFMNRANLAPTLTSAFHWGSFHLIPSIGVQETYYGETQAPDPLQPGLMRVAGTNIVRSARQFTLDMVFPMLERVYAKKTIFGDKLKHVIEPRATYRYVTGIGSDFDRFIRFDEMDLLANTNELELSLTNRIYAKRGDSVQEIFTWELMQKRYFDPTFGGALQSGDPTLFDSTANLTAYAFQVGPRSASPVVSLLRSNPVGGLGIQWQADYDPRLHAVMDSGFSADYHWKRYFLLVGNNQVASSPAQVTSAANQYQFRAGYGDANRKGWNAGFDVHYDYRLATVQYATTQVTYNTDCCGISVQYRLNNLITPARSEWRIAFAVGNIGTLGTLRKQDRLF
ncbi:MAG TPA: LPS assembly protein LptD [Bryobacteraceae bacterium]|nr:LPS assembly protein LptD [Bryobacteraceae bacterium]